MKRSLSAMLAAVLLLLSAGSLSGCADFGKRTYTAEYYDVFDTYTVLTGYARSEREFRQTAEEIHSELVEYHRLYDIYHTYEGIQNLATVNALTDGAHARVTVDERLFGLLQAGMVLYEATERRMNVGMGSVLSIWHAHRSAAATDPANATLPDAARLTAAAAHTDLHGMELDAETRSVYLRDPEMTLDVGALAKGYAVEQIAQKLEARGVSGWIINVGGNVRTLGAKPRGEAWTVGVEQPSAEEGSSAYVARVALSGQALVTSGSYQRYYEVDGVRYHHVIDPDTLYPSRYFTSVSVLADSSALADALSTALFCMSYEEGMRLIASYERVGVMWIYADGRCMKSPFFEAACIKE